ncbi:MAG: peptide deformylase [Aquificae bacterium]|nr:peptide deformylase [Aquificota bacterium]
MDYSIRVWPDKILKEKMQEVDFFNTEKLKDYVDIMFDKMYQLEGVGLAANQIGIPYQIIVIDTSQTKNEEYQEEESVKLALVNPKIVLKEGERQSTEGCLSFPGVQITIPRAERVVVEAKDISGESITLDATGFLSVVLQHEIDHINGIPFINYLSPTKKRLVLEKYFKKQKTAQKK